MQAFLEEKHEEIAELCRTHHVRRLAVFGSAAREDFDPRCAFAIDLPTAISVNSALVWDVIHKDFQP